MSKEELKEIIKAEATKRNIKMNSKKLERAWEAIEWSITSVGTKSTHDPVIETNIYLDFLVGIRK